VPEFINAAFGKPVVASDTCGLHGPERSAGKIPLNPCVSPPVPPFAHLSLLFKSCALATQSPNNLSIL